jgi:branched-chain amino acid transport system permease protein
MVRLIQNLVDGVTLGAVYVLIALSITLIFGLTRIVNFAVGTLLMIAAFIVYAIVAGGGSYWLGLVVAVAALALLGFALERVVFRWTLPHPDNGFVVSLGLILVLEAFATQVWGTTSRSVATPLDGSLHIGGVVIGTNNLVVLGVVVLATVGLLVWLLRSRDGRALRACSENREAAQLMGIPVTKLTALVFTLAIGLIGLAGALVTTYSTVQPSLGDSFVLLAFVIAIAGGLGNVTGTIVAGVLVAIVQSLAQAYLPLNWTDGFVFLVVILILIVRPEGLFGVRHG